ncbi:hypothetical protein J2X46_003558 [Nocardioides sp. BE266]|uniref:hypothetical protein n=1 Tax=Nocardioides sp. BE266 TaxID=2817725 RepID=UPI0028617A26|nr:hypothetical protein [Nocardioides sp. BE266]MDR7254565.1 hypothetical protein [Nocardioides sp. BE266]
MSTTGPTGSAGGSSFIGVFTATALPALIGALVAAGLIVTVVFSQTAGPDKNPASQQILVYGD